MSRLKREHCAIITGFVVCALILTIFLKAPFLPPRPHIIVIIADDLGRNDVGFLGSNQIPTPNIDALAYHGVIMDRFYTQCTCTPSRTAFLTGNYPIRSGLQGFPLKAGDRRGLAPNMPILPEHLRNLGYKTHLVGKWHLGASHRNSTPTGRGFDTHFGYWNGFVGYFDYEAFRNMPDGTVMRGFDLHKGFEPAWSDKGRYATELFTEKAEEIIQEHDSKHPLFLMVAHLAAHTGKNGTELEVPDENYTQNRFSYIQNQQRQFYADVVNRLDHSIGRIIDKLSKKNLLQNSVILFFSDNGAQTIGLYQNSGSNWPLRGLKFSEFEGGVRGTAVVFSPLLSLRNYINTNLIHLTDWLPTFYALAGGNVKDLGTIDGVNQWEVLSKNISTNRSEILLNIDKIHETSAIIGQNGRFKAVSGTYWNGTFDSYFGDPGRDLTYNIQDVLSSQTNQALEKLTSTLIQKDILGTRTKTDLSWCRPGNFTPEIDCTTGCLFNLETDPCETDNIINQDPKLAQLLFDRIRDFEKGLVPEEDSATDPLSNPSYYNGSWCTWLDDEVCSRCT